MAPGNDVTTPGTINGTSTSGSGHLDLELSPTKWPLWLEIGAPLLSALLFVAVNAILLLTHKAPPDANEGVPLSGLAENEGGTRVRKASKGGTYGSTENKKTGDNLCPAHNMAMTISMEETSLNEAIHSKPPPTTSYSGAPYHSENTTNSFDACAGACTSKSTEPLVHHAVNLPESGSDTGIHKNGGKRKKSSMK